jgi:hypothetical protein
MDPRYPFNDPLRLPGRRQIAVPVTVADDAVAVGNVDPLGVRPEWVEGDAIGLVEPLGKDFVGRVLPAGMRRTRTVLDVLSATNRSPFGATRMARGPARPDATISTEKPVGTLGLAPAGIATTSAKFGADQPIGGRSCGASSCFTPGLSCCHAPNAAFPFRSGPVSCAVALMPPLISSARIDHAIGKDLAISTSSQDPVTLDRAVAGVPP